MSSREDDGIVSIPKGRLTTANFGRTILRDLRTRQDEITNEMFPLDIIFDSNKTMDWQMEYLQLEQPETKDQRIEKWKRFMDEVIFPFTRYQVPTIELAKSTPKEAVCQVFEKVNTGGVTLTVFELLTATYAADDFNLRDDWESRKESFKRKHILRRFKETDFLQVVTLLAAYDRRMKHLSANPDSNNPPPVSCKRRDILKLPFEDYKKWSDPASEGLHQAAEFLRNEYIFRSWDVPYYTQLVPLGAVFTALKNSAQNFAALKKLRRWYWCGVLGEMYGGSTETRFAYDLLECVAWIKEEGDEPRTVTEAQFQAERLLSLRTRNSAAYKGLYALQMKNGSCDFKTGSPLEAQTYFDNSVDIHHIFPRRWCDKEGIERWITNSAVNKTPLSSYTNRIIGGRAPSDYLARLQEEYSIDSRDLDKILHSHDIDPAALRRDDFKTFFNRRFEKLLERIEEAMDKPVNRNPGRDESPFADPAGTEENIEQTVRDLIFSGESEKVEFKSTGRKNLYTRAKDPAIE